MSERYLPKSKFLKRVLSGEIELEDTETAERHVQKLLNMVHDADPSNRDWAAFLIAHLTSDTPAIREALLTLADGDDPDARDEALVGLARRAPGAALARVAPLLKEELGIVILEAVTILGDQSLLPALREIEGWDGEGEKVREQLRRALIACERGVGEDMSLEERKRCQVLSVAP